MQFFSQPNYIDIYFTKVGCGVSATVKYYHLVFPHKFPSGDYLFVYSDGENNFVGLIHPAPYSEDEPESYISD